MRWLVTQAVYEVCTQFHAVNKKIQIGSGWMWKIGRLLPILVASSATACRCSINRYQQPGRDWPSVWSAMLEVFRAQSWLNNLWTKTAGWWSKGRSWRNGRKGEGWEGGRGGSGAWSVHTVGSAEQYDIFSKFHISRQLYTTAAEIEWQQCASSEVRTIRTP